MNRLRCGAMLGVVVITVGCRPPEPAATQKATDPHLRPSGQQVVTQSSSVDLENADSVVLERTACLGTCPAYRLRLTRRGEVAFHSRNVGDTLRTGVTAIPEADAAAVFRFAEQMAFGALPDTIATVPAYCARIRTDHPTVTTTIFAGAASKRVVDYQGCSWAPAALRHLEALIDSTTHSSRWVRPNGFGRGKPRRH